MQHIKSLKSLCLYPRLHWNTPPAPYILILTGKKMKRLFWESQKEIWLFICLLLKLQISCHNCFIHVIYLHLGEMGKMKNTSASFFLNKRQQNPSGWVIHCWPSRTHRWNNTPSNDSRIFWNLPFEIGLGRLFAGTWVASVCNFANVEDFNTGQGRLAEKRLF